jgi:hypothetical protein
MMMHGTVNVKIYVSTPEIPNSINEELHESVKNSLYPQKYLI